MNQPKLGVVQSSMGPLVLYEEASHLDDGTNNPSPLLTTLEIELILDEDAFGHLSNSARDRACPSDHSGTTYDGGYAYASRPRKGCLKSLILNSLDHRFIH
jgi:hypothetical protein